MSTAYIEGLPQETFDRWFSLFEYVPALATLVIILALRNILLGFGVPIKRRVIELLVDIGCVAFVFLVRGWIRMDWFQVFFVFAEFALIYAAYFLKRKTYPDISKGKPAVLALWDFSILLIALAFWSFVRTKLFCMCL